MRDRARHLDGERAVENSLPPRDEPARAENIRSSTIGGDSLTRFVATRGIRVPPREPRRATK
jgi:hypothetical protein